MRTWVVAALLALLVTAAGADEKDARIAWLAKNAVQVKSIDPDDEDFEDLQPLKKIIGDARIVQLGEQTHGDGACFLAKARLIKFLHQEMGFDVLAFESGFYDCARGYENLRKDPKGVSEFDLGIFGIWTMSHEVKPTIDYLRTTAKSKRPLELCGYDCQLTSRVSRAHLEKDLRAAISKVEPLLLTGRSGQEFTSMMTSLLADKPAFSKKEYMAAVEWLVHLRTHLETGAGTLKPDARTYWQQMARSLISEIENIAARTSRKTSSVEDNNNRDRAMAENFIWLAKEKYPQRKIIVWAATFHLMRNPAKLRPLKGSLRYDKLITMGHVVAEHFGTACYTLGFTTYRGKGGRPFGNTKPWTLPTASPGTFDALCFAAGLENAILDLRAPPEGGKWLQQPFVTRPLGNAEMEGPWHEVLDGLFFQRDMTPSTRHGYTPPEPSGPFLEELERSWSNIESGLERGNAWANKWTLDPAFEKWQAAAEPNAKEIEKQEAIVAKFLKKHKDEPEAVWRAHALLATMATARKSPKDARKALEAAMKAYPDKDLAMVAKTGRFQHLVNAYAFLEWERTKKPPIQWAMGVLAKDKRLRLFWWPAWTERDAGVESKLKKALKKAYERRKKKFPDLAAEIDRALAGL